MRRRSFMQQIAALLGMSTIAPCARAAAPRLTELQHSPLAGFQYHRGESVWTLLAVGATLDLVREADNAHDARAVRVEWQGQKLGYVPRIDNATISHLLDTGRILHAEIIGLRESDDPWQRLEFSVHLCD